MKKRNLFWIIGIIVLVIMISLIFFRSFTGEDDWIKNSKGVWIKHGNPDSVPNGVNEQQVALNCSRQLYETALDSGVKFDSQCLGKCNDYSVDIVHVPRSPADNLIENQCFDYLKGVTHHFIELDISGNLFRVV